MRIVLQRVKQASVSVDGGIVGQIGTGILLFLGVHKDDTEARADFLAAKCVNLRIFPDDAGKMNLSLLDVNGAALVVSQFTLFGDCAKGNRPGFIDAAPADAGNRLYEYFIKKLREQANTVETGMFGAKMDVELVNDGPVTLILEK